MGLLPVTLSLLLNACILLFVKNAASVPIGNVFGSIPLIPVKITQLIQLDGSSHGQVTFTRNIVTETCLSVASPKVPTVIVTEAKKRGAYTLLGFSSENCSPSEESYEGPVISRNFHKTDALTVNERIPICSFVVEQPETDLSVTFTGETEYRKVVSGTGCHNLCGPSPFSVYAHSVQLRSRNGEKSSNSLALFLDSDCNSLIKSDVVTGTDLTRVTRVDNSKLVRSMMITTID